MASNPAQILPEWIVMVTLAHGGEIAGARRKKGDVFAASEEAVRYALLEGTVAPKPAAPAGKAVKSPDAPAAG